MWRKFHSEELHNLYISPNIASVFNSRRMVCEGHVVHMENMSKAYKIVVKT
jgi:hypothetical protein